MINFKPYLNIVNIMETHQILIFLSIFLSVAVALSVHYGWVKTDVINIQQKKVILLLLLFACIISFLLTMSNKL